ncbi:hypothetical protein [Mycoplasma elephantis]|uniref:hypothetical protein n=1 Tax=Mycoplasma elephantis TaxID=114882 RepID=UPI000481848A|nr:hypothetical protein [Mycoplasma elephantis]
MKFLKLITPLFLCLSSPLVLVSCGGGELTKEQKEEQFNVAERAIIAQPFLNNATNELNKLEQEINKSIDKSKTIEEIKKQIVTKLELSKSVSLVMGEAMWYYNNILHKDNNLPLNEEKSRLEKTQNDFISNEIKELEKIVSNTESDETKKKESLELYNSNLKTKIGIEKLKVSLNNANNSILQLNDIIEGYKNEKNKQ